MACEGGATWRFSACSHPRARVRAVASFRQAFWVSRDGAAGGGTALAFTHLTMLMVLLLHLRIAPPHDPSTWPGLRPLAVLRDKRANLRFAWLSAAALGVLLLLLLLYTWHGTVPLLCSVCSVSQSVSFTQPLAWGIGSLGRAHHPMKGCSCHHAMKVCSPNGYSGSSFASTWGRSGRRLSPYTR